MITRQPAYDAVYEVIRCHPGTAERNGVIWHAVEAALDAMAVPHGDPWPPVPISGMRETPASKGRSPDQGSRNTVLHAIDAL